MAFLDDSKSIPHRDTCTSILTAVLLIITKLWDQPTCPSADRINKLRCMHRQKFFSHEEIRFAVKKMGANGDGHIKQTTSVSERQV